MFAQNMDPALEPWQQAGPSRLLVRSPPSPHSTRRRRRTSRCRRRCGRRASSSPGAPLWMQCLRQSSPPPPWAPSVRNVAVYTPKDRPRPTPFQAHRRGRTPPLEEGPLPPRGGPLPPVTTEGTLVRATDALLPAPFNPYPVQDLLTGVLPYVPRPPARVTWTRSLSICGYATHQGPGFTATVDLLVPEDEGGSAAHNCPR